MLEERIEIMSKTVNLFYRGENGNARKFVEEMEKSGTADKIRQEPGNIKYEYYVSVADPEVVLLIDAWENQDAIDAHHASEMMQTLAALREKYDLHMQVEQYTEDLDVRKSDESFLRK